MKLRNGRGIGLPGPMRILALVATILSIAVFLQPAFAGGFGMVGAGSGVQDPRQLRLTGFQKYLEGDFETSRNYYEQAIQAAQKAYGADSSFVGDLYYEVGSISFEDGQFPIAEKYLKLAVEQKPCSVMARVKYADVLSMRGQKNEALNQIQQARSRNPGSPVAQQALVKWMMSVSSPKEPQGAKANVAATWESFRLRNVGSKSVKETIASINKWQKTLRQPPAQSTVAMMRTPAAPPVAKVEGVAKEPTKEPEKPKVEAKKKQKVTPPVVTAKAKPKEQKTVTASKPVEKPRVEQAPPPPQRAVVASSSKHTTKGFIPPPPPTVPVWGVPPPPTGFVLKTDAKIQKGAEAADKPAEKPKEEKKKAKPKPVADDAEPDFLLDWGAVGDKKKKKPAADE